MARVLRFLAPATILNLLLCSPSQGGELYIYEHNLSVINWFVVGDSITGYIPVRQNLLC